MRGVRRKVAERRHAAGRWMEDGSLGGVDVPDSAAERVVEANGSAYRALLDDPAGVAGGLPEVPEERWRSWLLGGEAAEPSSTANPLAAGAHRAGRRWERVEPGAGPVVVRAERSSSVASRAGAPRRMSSPPVPARRRWRALVLVVLGVVALGVGLSLAGWHAQPAAWRPPVRVRSAVAGLAASRPSAVAVDEEV